MPRLLCLALSLALLGACHDHAGVGREPDEYIGCATDENWAAFDDVSDLVSDAEGPQYMPFIQNPTLPNTPVELSWWPKPGQPADRDGDVPSTCAQWQTGYAPAHLPPVSGTVYDLQFSVDGTVVHRAITTLTRWQASPEVWSGFRGKTVSWRIRRMVILNNDRKEGPFVASTPATLTIAP